jgi:hypothetical protein
VDPKRRGGVVAPAILLQAPLVVEKRRILGEEYRKGAECDILQRVALVVATFAMVGQAAEGPANLLDQQTRCELR